MILCTSANEIYVHEICSGNERCRGMTFWWVDLFDRWASCSTRGTVCREKFRRDFSTRRSDSTARRGRRRCRRPNRWRLTATSSPSSICTSTAILSSSATTLETPSLPRGNLLPSQGRCHWLLLPSIDLSFVGSKRNCHKSLGLWSERYIL